MSDATDRRCHDCECPLVEGEFWVCRPCGEMRDAEVMERLTEEEQMPKCGCPYCFCSARTEDGGVCADCRNHYHQG